MTNEISTGSGNLFIKYSFTSVVAYDSFIFISKNTVSYGFSSSII